MRLTVKERVLLHLLEVRPSSDDAEVSPALAQEGVARGAGIELRHLAQFVRPLITDGLVRERKAHVSGIRQRRKVYELTPSGIMLASRLRGKVGAQVVRIRDGSAVRDGSIHEALQGIGAKTSLLAALRQVEQAGVLDLEVARRPPETGFVDQTADAPRLETFVGRRQELGEILRDPGGPRIVVVRGIAGIGKTALAARACDVLRGRKNLFWHRIRPWESTQMILASLGRFLESLDRPALVSVLKQGEVASAAEVLREDLPDTHAFLVFDDAHEAPPEVLSVFRMLAEAAVSALDLRILILTRRALPFYDVRDIALSGLVGEIELGGLPTNDAAALLAEGGDAAVLAGLPHGLAGHPLFLELVRRHRPDVGQAVRDMRRFMEDAVYRDLADPEREALKAACLYEVPVPSSSLLSPSEASHGVLAVLEDLALIRPVGSERFEIHDTIRDFLRDILTPWECERYGRAVAAQLRELTSQALGAEDPISSVAYLSNALHVTQSHEERTDLYEALGDANARIGDLLAMSTAYREGLRLASAPETLARLHRKLASILEDRGYIAAARTEVESGLAAIAGLECIESGWLSLAKARIVKEDMDWPSVERFAEQARVIFERSRNSVGQVHALLEAGLASSWTGSTGKEGSPQAHRRFRAALELAKALGDGVLEARIHLAMAAAICYGSGDYEEGMAHYRAVESCPAAMSDPNVGPLLYSQRGWFVLRTRRDLPAAEEDLRESERRAQRVHNVGALGTVQYLTAIIAAERGRYDDAARLGEDAGSALVRSGQMAYAADGYFRTVGFYLAVGDWAGYQRVSSALLSPQLFRYAANPLERPAAQRALDALIQGDVDGFERGFQEIFDAVARFPGHSLYHSDRLLWYHLYYSVGLRALGRITKSEDQLRQGLDLARSFNNALAIHILESDFGERIAQTIRVRIETG